jgi:hypothetical protein
MDKHKQEAIHARRMGWIYLIGGVFTIILIIAGIILGYFVSYVGHDGDIRDGLGRLVDTVPEGFSLILRQWAGFIWFFVDCIIIFSLVILTDRLFVRSRIYFTSNNPGDL